MTLTGRQAKQIADALLSAFPRSSDLEQLMMFGMNTNLNAVVGPGGLDKQVRELIMWAQSEGRVEELVASAVAAKPLNPAMRQLEIDIATWKSARDAVAASAPTPVNVVALRTAITNAFSVDELQILCFDVEQILREQGVDLAVNLETVGGASKPAQVLNLIQYLQRRGHLEALLQAVRVVRPGLI
jgi:hypothetical protein